MEIVVTHADSGKSGLTLAGREELQKLLEEAESDMPTSALYWSTMLAAGAGFKM